MGVKVPNPALQFAMVRMQAGRQPETSIKSINNRVNALPAGDLRPAKIAALNEG
jgi:hypothetical protein